MDVAQNGVNFGPTQPIRSATKQTTPEREGAAKSEEEEEVEQVIAK